MLELVTAGAQQLLLLVPAAVIANDLPVRHAL